MAGTRADNGKGAAVVIEDMHDLMPLVVSRVAHFVQLTLHILIQSTMCCYLAF
jgi:hypothetical protein